ncbi:membrane protein, putative [Babesia bigemina]|uniref:Membrane protein, putative n=1 Tax=Babesia bigemina TaxID=5866 RepID=A0A061D5L6_BABBI|nr:membrane protein, putative [Babesia bigemina]CDR94249.1 membrane protein, putative [Babesia bigemina]|eukprot:XP_012766435.1 membrane protein, putative [Babesia bigemina]
MRVYFMCLLVSCWQIAYCVDGTQRIGPGKFRFDDEIAYIADEDTLKTINSGQIAEVGMKKLARISETHKISPDIEANKHAVIDGNDMHDPTSVKVEPVAIGEPTQSVGYTVESYPNPFTDPHLCVHTAKGTSTFLCDPDGILSDCQQVEANEILSNANSGTVSLEEIKTIGCRF